VPRQHRRRRLGTSITVLLLAAFAVLTYLIVSRVKPLLTGSGCQAVAGQYTMPLDTEQAGIAATIAGVAQQRGLSSRAVSVAYAAALQESKLHNLNYGDRDSVGVFQQRPSEGWGPARKLEDPVYATTRFFQVLSTVPHYQRIPVYKAAQAVQHSADGAAYIQYQGQAGRLASVFTGHDAHAVWCWSPSAPAGKARLGAVDGALARAFGRVGGHQADPPAVAPALLLRAPDPAMGWAIASWLVTHAAQYRLHEVRYAGYQWQAGAGSKGWTRDPGPALAGRVRAS
jgi:hypothetical protein